MVGLVHINHVLGVDMVCAAPKALAERAEANFPRKASKVPKQLHCRSKSPKPLGSRGGGSRSPFWRRKSSESSKLLRILTE